MPETVLIVEDEAEVREVYRQLLTEAGLRVLEAEDGQEGLKKLSAEAVDVVLLDVMLPKVDGLELLRVAKAQGLLEKARVILITNLVNDEVRQEGFRLGAVGYLVKSDITPDKVVEEVKKAIAERSR